MGRLDALERQVRQPAHALVKTISEPLADGRLHFIEVAAATAS